MYVISVTRAGVEVLLVSSVLVELQDRLCHNPPAVQVSLVPKSGILNASRMRIDQNRRRGREESTGMVKTHKNVVLVGAKLIRTPP